MMVKATKGLSKGYMLFIFLFGGFCYGALEVLWRGYTHIAMIILGGICLLGIYSFESFLKGNISVISRGLIYALFITFLEFISGMILNIKFGLEIWDYSALPLDLYGQICVPFSFLWFLLSLVCCILCSGLRIMCGEDI